MVTESVRSLCQELIPPSMLAKALQLAEQAIRGRTLLGINKQPLFFVVVCNAHPKNVRKNRPCPTDARSR